MKSTTSVTIFTGSGIQRGGTSLVKGDPLSPDWPSVKNAYRLDPEDVSEDFPKIPVQPIGYVHCLSKQMAQAPL